MGLSDVPGLSDGEGLIWLEGGLGGPGLTAAAFSPLSLAPFLWLDPSDLSTLFQDAAMTTPVTADSDPVGAILDKSGNGHHLTQATGAARPLYNTAGGLHWLETDGVQQFFAATVSPSIPQPITRISAIRQLDWSNPSFIFPVGPDLRQTGSSPRIAMDAGSAQIPSDDAAINADVVVIEVFNGASSSLTIDAGTAATGDPGANALDHIGFGAQFDGSLFASVRLYGVTIFDRLLTAPEIARLRTYLASKQGRVL